MSQPDCVNSGQSACTVGAFDMKFHNALRDAKRHPWPRMALTPNALADLYLWDYVVIYP